MKKLFIIISVLLLILGGCDAITDLSDQGTVNVKLADNGDSRYIAGEGETVDEAVLGFVVKDVVYNVDYIEEIDDFNGEHLFTGIPVGDYSFLALLMSDDDIISMAIQDVSIKAGRNDLVIDMGPGFHLKINTLEFDMDDLSEEFSLSLNGNEVTIGVEKEELEKDLMELEIRSNAAGIIITPDEVSFTEYTTPVNDLSFEKGYARFNPAVVNELEMELVSSDGSSSTYTLIFEKL